MMQLAGRSIGKSNCRQQLCRSSCCGSSVRPFRAPLVCISSAHKQQAASANSSRCSTRREALLLLSLGVNACLAAATAGGAPAAQPVDTGNGPLAEYIEQAEKGRLKSEKALNDLRWASNNFRVVLLEVCFADMAHSMCLPVTMYTTYNTSHCLGLLLFAMLAQHTHFVVELFLLTDNDVNGLLSVMHAG